MKKSWYIVIAIVVILALIVIFVPTMFWKSLFDGVNGNAILTGNIISNFNEPFRSNFNMTNITLSHNFSLSRNVNITALTIQWTDNGRSCYAMITGRNYSSGWKDVSSPGTLQLTRLGVSDYVNISIIGCSSIKIYYMNISGFANQTSMPEILSTCDYKCAINGTGVSPPIIRVLREACYYNNDCGTINVSHNNGGNVEYEFRWKYYYTNGSTREVCGCNGTTLIGGGRVSSGITAGDYSFPLLINDNLGIPINKVEFGVAVLKNGNRSSWTSKNITLNYSCLNECNTLDAKRCNITASNSYNVCGNFDGDVCLEWSSLRYCDSGDICNPSSNSCVFDSTVSCTGFCYIAQPGYSVPASGSCVAGYSCYRCNENYSWKESTKRCEKDNCTSTCPSNAVVSLTTIANALNSTNETCGLGSCWMCNNGFHAFNGSCISNNCGGSLPSTNASSGTLFGANNFTEGNSLSWIYTDNSILTACTWSCNATTHRNLSVDFDGCLPGLGPCRGNIGCVNSSTMNVSGAINITGDCPNVDDKCYRCGNVNEIWNGSSCRLCGDNQVLREGRCVDSNFCINGCIYNDSSRSRLICLKSEYRINTGEGALYCGSDHAVGFQKEINASCGYNFECRTNYCGNGHCIDILANEQNQTNLLSKILCYLKRILGIDSNANCG